jgi:peptidyl-Asp metalloendopeptidase
MNHLPCRTMVASALLAILGLAPANAAPPPEVVLMLESRATAASLPEHARGGTAVAGRFNSASLGSGRVRVDLPNGRSLVAARMKETRGNRGDVSWAGEFEGQPGSLLVMTSHRGKVTGFMHDGEDIWELETGPDGSLVMFQVDEDMQPHEHEPISVELDADDYVYTDAELDGFTATAADPVVQDLLLVYTPAAVAKAGSIATLESRMLNAVSAANAAYVNSKVGIRLNVVGMVQTNYTETGDIAQTLTRLRGTTDGYMDEIHRTRDSLGADLVAMISEDSNACGVAYVMSNPSSGFASAAFSVTRQSCFSNQTLAHEIGHNQGNSHDRKNGGSSAYPYSFGYRTCDNIAPTNGQSFRTVMAYSCSGSRVNYFSNPDVYYNGAPMGVAYETDAANSADNARSMNNTAPITASFRGAASATAPVAPSSLQGSASSSHEVRLTWRDNADDETGFTLQRATNGGSFADRASLAANTTSFTDSGLVAGTTYSYRVRAWNSVGNSDFSNTVTIVMPEEAPPPPPSPEPPSPATVEPVTNVATVRWSDVLNETGYEALRETLNPRNGRWSATTLSIPADITSFSETLNSGTYRYAVRAVNTSGTSEWVTASCSGCGSDGSFTVATSGTSSGTTKKGGGKNKDKNGGGRK